MKMHSYITTNGQLKISSDYSKTLLEKLQKATLSVGGWEKALSVAIERRTQLDELSGMSNSPDVTAASTPDVNSEGISISFMNASAAAALRKRLVAVASDTTRADTHSTALDAPSSHPSISEAGFVVHPLVDHPDAEISTLAKELSEIQSELASSGPNPVLWPNNITFKNFAVYQLIPTLVYELEYPRTDRFVIYSLSTRLDY